MHFSPPRTCPVIHRSPPCLPAATRAQPCPHRRAWDGVMPPHSCHIFHHGAVAPTLPASVGTKAPTSPASLGTDCPIQHPCMICSTHLTNQPRHRSAHLTKQPRHRLPHPCMGCSTHLTSCCCSVKTGQQLYIPSCLTTPCPTHCSPAHANMCPIRMHRLIPGLSTLTT